MVMKENAPKRYKKIRFYFSGWQNKLTADSIQGCQV